MQHLGYPTGTQWESWMRGVQYHIGLDPFFTVRQSGCSRGFMLRSAEGPVCCISRPGPMSAIGGFDRKGIVIALKRHGYVPYVSPPADELDIGRRLHFENILSLRKVA